MTHQEIYDKVCTHMAAQERRAFDTTTKACEFLTHDGRKCAVGCLLPDSLLGQIPNCSASTLIEEFPTARKVLGVRNSVFLDHLQTIHDDSEAVNDLIQSLTVFARNYGLRLGAEKKIKTWS